MPKKRLLVVEDDIDVAEMLIMYFSGQGYDVINAMTGNDGIQLARAKFPNLILLDVMLPDIDGFEVCKVLRNTTLTKYVPITFLTQRDSRADKVAGLELGADDYVTKPFDLEELRLRIQTSLRRSSRESLQDPRTGLPTNALIEEMYSELSGKPGFANLDIRLVGLSAFRDKYGFVAADEALTFTGQVLSETIAQHGTSDDFAGANGEDQYTMFTFAPVVEDFVAALTERFASGAKAFYNFVDSENGFIAVNEGTDYEERAPLMHFVVNRVETALAS